MSEPPDRTDPPSPGRLELGASVSCTDGPFGELEDFVIDSARKRVTHLVVQATHVSGPSRLVPIGLVQRDDQTAVIALGCALAEAEELPPVPEVSYMRLGDFDVEDPDWDIGVREVFSMPTYDAGAFVDYQPDPSPSLVMRYDRIPKGEAEIRRESAVTTSDGYEIGHVDAILLEDGAITHIVVRRGHLWKRTHLTIPTSAIAEVSTDNVGLRLSKRELKTLRASS